MIYGVTMQQSSPLRAALPAWLALTLLGAALPTNLSAFQDEYRVLRPENFRREPGPSGVLLAFVNEGVVLEGGERRDGWVQVTLDGWIWGESVRAVDDGIFQYEVIAGRGENLRSEPNGSILARLEEGVLLEGLERNGAWIRVSRTAWMFGRSLRGLSVVPNTPPPAASPTPANNGADPPSPALPAAPPTDGGSRLDRAVVLEGGALRVEPDGDTTAAVAADLPVRVVARSGEWVRVRTEGWVHESEVRPASGDVLVGVSGAEVRAAPEDFEGRLVQWTLQHLAIRTGDGLRREIPQGQWYMMARGPIPEAGFVYVLLSGEQVEAVERLSPLAEIVVIARVRVGRDRFLGNPVVELVEMSAREP